MSIIAWSFLGLIFALIAGKVVGARGGIFMNMILGVVGAIMGGGIFNFIGQAGITGFNIWSVFVASMGAMFVLVIYHAVTGRPPSHA